MKSKLLLFALLLMGVSARAHVADVTVYQDCSENGTTVYLTPIVDGSAAVLSTDGRTSCEYVQLWEGGPKWATFNVGATITDYADLTIGADDTPYSNYTDQAPYYNTANVGGLYAWNQPNYNGRNTTWTNSVATGVADVATTLWGSNWKTPTYQQLITLLCGGDKTIKTWCDGSTTQYVPGCTLKGYKITGVGAYASKSIFMPAAGTYTHNTVGGASKAGCYYDSQGSYVFIDSEYIISSCDEPYLGNSVRAVLDETNSSSVEINSTQIEFNSIQNTLILYADGCNDPNTFICVSGQELSVKAIPMMHRHFLRWADGNTDNPRTIVLDQDITLTAIFETDYSVISNCEHGFVLGAGEQLYKPNDTISLFAIPDRGYHFLRWADSNTDNPRTVVMTQDTTMTAIFEADFSVISNCEHGFVLGAGEQLYKPNDIISLLAIADRGYHFLRWADGNTDNPRTVVMTQDTTMTALFELTYSGRCGEDAYWKYANGELFITGTGDVNNSEWSAVFLDSINMLTISEGITQIGRNVFEYLSQISSVVIPNTVINIDDNAFNGCVGLQTVTIGRDVETIGQGVFGGCTKLLNINCYPVNPPAANQNSFANYNVYINVPCDNLMAYQTDFVFGSFKYIRCIGAEEVIVTTTTVTPSATDATFAWPTSNTADTYIIEITKDGVVFCVLTFNANGQLLNIAFAPGRNGAAHAPEAELTANGYQFTVTGLESGSTYAYTLDAKDAGNNVVANYSGTFTTISGAMGVDGVSKFDNTPTKVIVDGQLHIIRDEKIYTVEGSVVK